MIYTFKVLALDANDESLETTHCVHGADVLSQAKALIDKHPQCGGVEVLVLGARLFFMPPGEAPTGQPQGVSASGRDESCG
jgi:hypothetical protein